MTGPDAAAEPPASGSPAGRAAWLQAAATVLRRSGRLSAGDPDERASDLLRSEDFEGLPIPALGTAELTGGLPDGGVPGRPPFTRGARAATTSGWDIRSYLADPDTPAAATAALADLEGGVTSLWVRVGGSGTSLDRLEKVLAGVHLDLAPVVLEPAGDIRDLQASSGLGGLLRRRGVRAHPHSNLGADPVGRYIRSGAARGDVPLSLEKPVCRSAMNASEMGVRAFVVDATVAHERGAGDSAELGYSLAVGVAYLREMAGTRLDLGESLAMLEFRYAATDDLFATIAKFRAARLLWDRVAEVSGAGPERTGQAQHAVTSRLMMTRYDSWTNLIRTTAAAFAAGVGGAQAITALPFDSALGVPDPLGRRLARNISHLLIGESHVTAAADPAGGAFAVEQLTWQLAEAGWAEFQRIEAAGAVVGALHDRSLLQRWDSAGDRREARVATRVQPITGISEYPQAHERLPERKAFAFGGDGGQFYTAWSEPFETMRDQPVVGSVFLAGVGSTADQAARSAFVRNAFAAGGIDTQFAGRTGGTTAVLDAYRAAGTPEVVCIVGSDRGYADAGADLVYGLRAVGAERVILAGRPSGPLADLVDDHLAAGDDVVQFLLRTRHAMGFPDKPTAEWERA